MNEEKKITFLEAKILPILNYVGAIGALIMCVAYVIVIFILINGFKAEKVLQTTVFAIVSAAVGLVIMQFLKYQGISFAEMDPENKKVIDEYYKKTKDKKNHSLTYFWITSGIKDVIMKGATVAATSVGIIYIVIQGSHDYNLLLLAFVNLLMFICFGFLSLVKAYKYVFNKYIPYLKEKIDEGGQGNGGEDNLS